MPPTDVHFYFDPGCPWTWVTSRWLVAAAGTRDLAISWHPYSLKIKNGDRTPDQFRATAEDSHRALRVIVRLREDAGNVAVGAFYTERGHRVFGGSGEAGLTDVLIAAGLDPAYAAAADDDSLDAIIQAEMRDAHQLAGESNGSPIMAVADSDRGFFGPVLTAVPADPGALWDHVRGLSAVPEVHELKRERSTPPSFPARP